MGSGYSLYAYAPETVAGTKYPTVYHPGICDDLWGWLKILHFSAHHERAFDIQRRLRYHSCCPVGLGSSVRYLTHKKKIPTSRHLISNAKIRINTGFSQSSVIFLSKRNQPRTSPIKLQKINPRQSRVCMNGHRYRYQRED